MICPKCKAEQPEGNPECLRCGVIFAKLTPEDYADPPAVAAGAPDPPGLCGAGCLSRLFAALFLDVEPEPNPVLRYGRLLTYAVFLVWGTRFILSPINGEFLARSFMHNINLPFHEAGHIVFSLPGIGLDVLGGSLLQILMPAICAGAYVYLRNLFAASIALWWTAQNFMDLAPYIDDARRLALPLLGGITGAEDPEFHDWHHILGHLGWLRYDHVLARISFGVGVLLMILAFAWGGYVLFRQFRRPGGVEGARSRDAKAG